MMLQLKCLCLLDGQVMLQIHQQDEDVTTLMTGGYLAKNGVEINIGLHFGWSENTLWIRGSEDEFQKRHSQKRHSKNLDTFVVSSEDFSRICDAVGELNCSVTKDVSLFVDPAGAFYFPSNSDS